MFSPSGYIEFGLGRCAGLFDEAVEKDDRSAADHEDRPRDSSRQPGANLPKAIAPGSPPGADPEANQTEQL